MNVKAISAAFGVLVCALHLGKNEYLSVQFILFFTIAALNYRVLIYSTECHILLIASLLLSVAANHAGNHDEHQLYVSIRTSVVCVILYSLTLRYKYNATQYININYTLYVAGTISAIIAIAQFLDSLTINSGTFDIPENFFSLNYGTIFTEKREILSNAGYFIRPSALYSEPSALALLGVICLYHSIKSIDKILFSISIIILILSQSMSGLLIYLIIILKYSNYKYAISRNGSLSFLLMLLIFFSSIYYNERILNIISGDDVSTSVRFTDPLIALKKIFSDGVLFGIPKSDLYYYIPSNISTIYDNWIINQLLYHGLLSAIPLIIFFISFDKKIIIVVVLIAMTNGDALYYDRFVLLFILIASNASAIKKPLVEKINRKNEPEIIGTRT